MKYVDPSGHDLACGLNCRSDEKNNVFGDPPPPDEEAESQRQPLLEDSDEGGVRGPDAYILGAGGSIQIPLIDKIPYLSKLSYFSSGGVELLSLVGDDGWPMISETEMFHHGGASTTFGAGTNVSIYGGGVWNLPNGSTSYEGSFETINGTISIGHGVTAAYFWAPSTNVPLIDALTPGNTKGFYIGYAPGAKASISYTRSEYGNTGKVIGESLAYIAWNGNFGGDSLMDMFSEIQHQSRR